MKDKNNGHGDFDNNEERDSEAKSGSDNVEISSSDPQSDFSSHESMDIDSGKNFTSIKNGSHQNKENISDHNDLEDNNQGFSRKIKKSRRNKYFFGAIWFVLIAFISVLLAGYALTSMNDMLGIGESNIPITVEIPENPSLDTVAGILKNDGIIRQESFFKIYCFITKNSKKFASGTFELKPNMDYQAIINHIKSTDENITVEIAFREGMNVIEYADLLSENEVCSKEKFLEKCNSNDFDDKYDFLKDIANKDHRYYKLEGYLFPDTYEFYKNEDPATVIGRFLSNFQKKIIKVNSHKGYEDNISIKRLCEEAGKTLDEVLNISSMIQAEAANNDDMYKVSSVIHNRLGTLESDGQSKFGEFGLSKLGIDSTVWYPYKTRATVPQDIVDSFNSRYDTYDIKGLPPGPICNFGMEAVYATLKPSNTEYYYFCHSTSGEAYYAKTNDVHLANLKKAGLV